MFEYLQVTSSAKHNHDELVCVTDIVCKNYMIDELWCPYVSYRQDMQYAVVLFINDQKCLSNGILTYPGG